MDHAWVSLLIGLAASSVFLIQLTIVLRNARRDRSWSHVEAEVIATRPSYGDGAVRTIVATYGFLADDGRTYIGHGTVDRTTPTGTGIEVLYDPADPKQNQLRRRPGLAYIGPGVLGLLLLAVGLFGIVNGVMELTGGHGTD